MAFLSRLNIAASADDGTRRLNVICFNSRPPPAGA